MTAPRAQNPGVTGRSSARNLAVLAGVLVGFAVVWGGLVLGWYWLATGSWSGPDRLPQAARDVYTVGLYLAIPFLLAWFWRRLEGQTWDRLGVRWRGRDLVAGLALGMGCIVGTYAVALAVGWTRWRDPGPWPWHDTGLDLVGAAAMGLVEEVAFRGVILRSLLRDHAPWRAIALSALIFAGSHLLRTGMTWLDAVTMLIGLLVTGLLLGYAAYARSLWLSLGLHAPWIFFISLSSQHHLWNYLPGGHLWTGAGYPPRGLLTILAMLAALAWLVWRRKRNTSPSLQT